MQTREMKRVKIQGKTTFWRQKSKFASSWGLTEVKRQIRTILVSYKPKKQVRTISGSYKGQRAISHHSEVLQGWRSKFAPQEGLTMQKEESRIIFKSLNLKILIFFRCDTQAWSHLLRVLKQPKNALRTILEQLPSSRECSQECLRYYGILKCKECPSQKGEHVPVDPW